MLCLESRRGVIGLVQPRRCLHCLKQRLLLTASPTSTQHCRLRWVLQREAGSGEKGKKGSVLRSKGRGKKGKIG
jgi:hypothetical protein